MGGVGAVEMGAVGVGAVGVVAVGMGAVGVTAVGCCTCVYVIEQQLLRYMLQLWSWQPD